MRSDENVQVGLGIVMWQSDFTQVILQYSLKSLMLHMAVCLHKEAPFLKQVQLNTQFRVSEAMLSYIAASWGLRSEED